MSQYQNENKHACKILHEKGDQNQGQQDTISKIALKHRQKDRAAFSDFF